MTRLLSIAFLTFLIAFSSIAQKVNGYEIYNSKGKKVTYEKMIKFLENREFVFFGEYHDNPISHWLQLEVLEDLYEVHGSNLVMAFEMFEQDQQELLDAYLNEKIESKVFQDSCRLWPNYQTDYKPLLDFARMNDLKSVASNIPRRYASLLFKRGREALDALSEEEKSWVVPLDFVVDTTLSQYAKLQEMAMHGSGNFTEAQAIKDATMAHFSLENMSEESVLYHINGAYHSDYYQGIIWYIKQKRPDANIGSITTVTQEDVNTLKEDNKGRADFIICVNENMTSTH